MNTHSKTLVSVLIPLFILGAIICVYYLKQPETIQNKRCAFKISSKALNKEFLMNDSLANEKYGNKIIELTGNIANIRKSDMHGIIVTLDDPMMGIKCVLDTTIKSLPTEIAVGSSVNVKGVCVGSDDMIGVMMNQCFISFKR